MKCHGCRTHGERLFGHTCKRGGLQVATLDRFWRIQMLLQRTEERGASEAEESSAARMVCKLLRQFPNLLNRQPNLEDIEVARHQQASRPFRYATDDDDDERPEFPGNTKVSIRYTRIVRQTESAILVAFASGRQIWLPLSQIKLKTFVVEMPRWLAQSKDLV